MEKVTWFPLCCPRQSQVEKSQACSLVVVPFFCPEVKSVKLHEAAFFSFEQEVHHCLHHQLRDAEIKIIMYKYNDE